MKRKGKISRKTKETSISVDLNIDGKGKYKIDTGIGFLNHMLEQLSNHSSIGIIACAYLLIPIDFFRAFFNASPIAIPVSSVV